MIGRVFTASVLGLIVVLFVLGAGHAQSDDSASLKAIFRDPPREYATAPLWVWNDLLTEEQIRSTLQDLAGQKVKQVFVHPRPGLMTPYLSKDWFRLWRVALDEAERSDMNIWIYDENSYPSGFAGGLVPEAMPQSRGRGLVVSQAKSVGKLGEDVLAVYRLSGDGYENVTRQARAGEKLSEGDYEILTWKLAPTGGWFGGTFYVDLLKPGVTEKFIEITFEAYRRELGDQFGKRIPGIFTDEPHLRPAGGLHWNDHLSEEFFKRWGYRMEDHFPALSRTLGDWKRVRHNYRQLLLEQFIEHWSKPCYEFCERNGIEFTGHYWEHGWPGTSHGPDNMAMYAWHQRPAIDCLMNRYSEDMHAQFGNFRAVKELSSVANQLGRKRTLCEAYGAGGWDLRFEDMKRIGDWLYVLGVNTMNEHLSYITIRGARKRDHPQSFSYHEPWWQDYHLMAGYFTRLSAALSAGRENNRVLVLEPTTSGWMYQGDSKQLQAIGGEFQKLVTDLAKAQVEYDLGCEDIMARHGSVAAKEIVVGQRKYDTLVLPPRTENLNAPVMALVAKYAAQGGRVLCCGPPPSLVDGRPSDLGKEAAASGSWQPVPTSALIDILRRPGGDGFSIRQEGEGGILLHQRRQLDDGQLVFLVNTSIDQPVTGRVTGVADGIERWDAATGKVSPYPSEVATAGCVAAFQLPPCGSLLLLLANDAGPPTAVQQKEERTIQPTGPPQIRRLEPNVLTIDYVDIAAAGQSREKLHFYRANEMAFKSNGLERNPWDSAVQLRDQLITRTFPADSGFEAKYRFSIERSVPDPLEIVVERPDLYAIACNGTPVKAASDAWWLDKAFGRIDITATAKVGENVVTIKARPMTIYHELEPAYLLGDFNLKPVESGFVVVPPQPLKLAESGGAAAGWDRQGHPFYAAGVAYTETFDVPKIGGTFHVRVPSWYGSVARVIVNGELAGHIAYQPWQCEVTRHIRPGSNEVKVTVIGTLKNTLGPHHAGAMRGAAWPHAFRQGPEHGPPPGEKYDTIGYGLFEPFVLVQNAAD